MPRCVKTPSRPLVLLLIQSRIRVGCFNISTVFSHAQSVVICSSCSSVLCQPTGGRARLTEGEHRFLYGIPLVLILFSREFIPSEELSTLPVVHTACTPDTFHSDCLVKNHKCNLGICNPFIRTPDSYSDSRSNTENGMRACVRASASP
jgi:hypothetical protein